MNRRFLSFLTPVSALVLAGVLGVLVTGSAQADDPECRPDGLYRQPDVAVPYCDVYDAAGRETMDSPRRSIGYFASWRTGKDGTPAYLVDDIPWDKITHVNYAFAHVEDDRISVGSDRAGNPAIGMEWPDVPGAEMDPDLPYKGHFNLLNGYKQRHPGVKTLISVGGWAETGGYFGDDGKRVADGGFYTLAESQSKIDTFADSVVEFLRKYGFDGVDIDYEYATSANHAGNPLDFQFSDTRRASLMSGYVKLMKTLREKLNAASAEDGEYYMSTAAVSASGWILRGSESYQVTQYLDYANIMSYDLHGAWNEFVGPNAALYDDGNDAELKHWNVYGTYGMGYLNTDWAYHYFRGSMPAGRINLGTPFYTRGWKNVTGGTNGLWGKAPLPDQNECPEGTGGTIGSTVPCGDGAVGIDNIWHDFTDYGEEVPSGVNPMWHAKNLEEGIQGGYVEDYGLDPENDPADRLTGTYTRHYADTMEAPWLWNADKKVFLSTEDEESMAAKIAFVRDQGLGGIMFWEMSGDYAWDDAAGEYRMGTTLIDQIDAGFADADPYDATKSNVTMPDTQLDVNVTYSDYAVGDANYPINPTMTIKNNSSTTITGGAVLEFDYATSAPCDMTQQSGWSLTTVKCGHTGNNTGGLDGDFQRAALTVPSWQNIAPGASVTVKIVYRLPISTPSNYVLRFGGRSYALSADHPRLADPGGEPTATTSTPTTDPPDECTAAAWEPSKVYNGGNTVSHKGHNWQSKWWTQGEEPGTTGEWGVWRDLGACLATLRVSPKRVPAGEDPPVGTRPPGTPAETKRSLPMRGKGEVENTTSTSTSKYSAIRSARYRLGLYSPRSR